MTKRRLHLKTQGRDLQNILRFSYDYLKFIVRSTYDSDIQRAIDLLQRAKIFLRNIVSQWLKW